jgi:DNA-binding CsgD family transcriptional regulator
MTVRNVAAATGINESTLRQLLKGLAKKGGNVRRVEIIKRRRDFWRGVSARQCKRFLPTR